MHSIQLLQILLIIAISLSYSVSKFEIVQFQESSTMQQDLQAIIILEYIALTESAMPGLSRILCK